jgi:hemerythrin-like domain-containing protein
MKITDRLVGDHISFRKMIGDLNVIADAPRGGEAAPKLIRHVELFKDHLMLHAWAEDTFYYPAVREALAKAPPPIDAAYMDHLDDEHRTVDGYLFKLEAEVKQTPPATYWRQTFALFAKGLQAHMKKEEEELFPISEKMLGAPALEDLSRLLEKNRSKAPAVRFHHPGK